MRVDMNKIYDFWYKLVAGVLLFAYALIFSLIFFVIGVKSEIPYGLLFFCYVALCVFYTLLTSHCFVSFFEKQCKVKLKWIGYVSFIVYALYIIIFVYSVYLKLHNLYNNIPFTTRSILIDTVFIPAFVTCISIDRVRDSIKKIRNTNS